MDRISKRSRGLEFAQVGDIRVASLLFVDDVVLLASLDRDLQCPLEQFAAECDVVGLVDCSVHG